MKEETKTKKDSLKELRSLHRKVNRLEKANRKLRSKIMIGTSHGNFHGVCTRIATGCLKAQMIDTIDLGFNVTLQRFVNEAIAHEAYAIGIIFDDANNRK